MQMTQVSWEKQQNRRALGEGQEIQEESRNDGNVVLVCAGRRV